MTVPLPEPRPPYLGLVGTRCTNRSGHYMRRIDGTWTCEHCPQTWTPEGHRS